VKEARDQPESAALVAPPAHAEAELFSRPMGAGRTRPLALHVRRGDGSLVECVVKPSARLTMPPTEYLFEWLGAAIGRALGVNVPEPLAVEITTGFAASIDDADARTILAGSTGLAFGSTYEKGFTQIPKPFALSTALREEAARVLAFDVYVHNADRRHNNANLFVARDQFLAFDHEQAFAFLLAIGGQDPVEDDCADILAQHVLRPLLRGALPSLDEFVMRLQSLDDPFFQGLAAATPPAWTTGAALGKIDRVIDVLRRRRDAAPRWVPRVEAWMAR
jgi:hypothetical protein